jgi:hypothetical protein
VPATVLPLAADMGDDAPAAESDTADALACPDCGKPARTPAGLAAHRRAKHEES